MVRVKDIMSQSVVSANIDDSLREALTSMVEDGVSVLPVLDGRGRCVGVLSSTDVVAWTYELGDRPLGSEGGALAKDDLERVSVKERMTDTVESVDPEADLQTASREMLRHKVHHLPVVDSGGRVHGIIGMTDLLLAYVEAEGT